MTMLDRRIVRPSPQPVSGVAAVRVRVPIHTILSRRDVVEVPVVVHVLDADTSEVLIDGTVVGYIRYDGRHFVALAGDHLADAQPCGSSELWDHAVARLYETSL